MIHYFGTNLTAHGHFLWQINEYGIGKNYGRVIYRLEDLPFNPEGLPYNIRKVGQAVFYQFAGFCIYAICGSPVDDRPGSKSVFFVEEIISEDKMIERVRTYQIAQKIIEGIK